jgi:hypothetical protein
VHRNAVRNASPHFGPMNYGDEEIDHLMEFFGF